MEETIIREARLVIERYVEIDWSQYSEGEIEYDEYNITCNVVWTRKSNEALIQVTNIWTDTNGHILQCGRNYGALSH
jgi:hypothetical protein